MNPWQPVEDFEYALCAYTGARFAVAVNSCTAALLLALKRIATNPAQLISIPTRTYVSVACAVKNAGKGIAWRSEEWTGCYQLRPYPIWDCALRFTSGMYVAGQFQCVSFAAAKILAAEQGGAILHDDPNADAWFRQMRYDGRTPGVEVADDHITLVGHHCPMTPSVAAALHLRLAHLPKNNADQVRSYPDISKHPAFQ